MSCAPHIPEDDQGFEVKNIGQTADGKFWFEIDINEPMPPSKHGKEFYKAVLHFAENPRPKHYYQIKPNSPA